MKKGLALGVVIGLIAILVGFIIILGVVYLVLFPFGSLVGGDFMCHISIMFRSWAKEPPGVGGLETVSLVTELSHGYEMFGINCKPSVEKIKSSYSDERVMQTIADNMARCWWKIGEGKYDFYSDLGAFWDAKDNNMCILCSEIRMKGGGVKSIDANKMEEYLYSTTHLASGKSYADYIIGTGNRRGTSVSAGTFEIEENKPLYVILKVNKEENLESKAGRTVQTFIELETALFFARRTGRLATGAKLLGKGNIFYHGGILLVSAINSAFTQNGFNANVYLYSAEDIGSVCSQLM